MVSYNNDKTFVNEYLNYQVEVTFFAGLAIKNIICYQKEDFQDKDVYVDFVGDK